MNKIILYLLFFLNFKIKCYDVESSITTTTEIDLYEEVDSENYVHYKNIIDLLTENRNLSTSCSKQIIQFLVDLGQEKEWTHQVIDSFGKPTSGLLNGFFPRFK